MYNFLMTGSSGFLGKTCLEYLGSRGHLVRDINELQNKRIDITHPFQLDPALTFNAMIHIAGKAHATPRSAEEEKVFFDVNYQGTINLCTAIDGLNTKPGSFIFVSTVAVYGIDSGKNIGEDHPLNGKTPYACSKILAEKFLEKWAKQNNIALTILRLPLIAGQKPPGNLGAMIRGIQSGRYLSIGKATARKSMVWVEDVADLMPRLIKTGGIYNLTDGFHPSFRELENVICKALGKKTPPVIPFTVAALIAKAGDIIGNWFPINTDKLGKISSTLTFNDMKARDELNWQPSPVLDKLDKSL